jgi:two-component system, LytTR family, sensor kinase
MFHPVLGNRSGKIVFAVSWIAVAAIHTSVYYLFYGIPVLISIVDSILWSMLFAILSLGLWYWVRISDIETQKPISIAINHIGGGALSILLLISAHRFLLSLLYPEEINYIAFLDQSLPNRTITAVFLYLLIALVYYLIIYISNFREKVSREAELKALVKDAELSWLKLQVNPHFLFNSLNSISSLTITSPSKAQEMITRLSELLRYSLKQSPDSMVPLSAELENCQKYLEIEKVRFGKRLCYQIECCQDCLNILVPSMILQPLFENAIKHSVAQSVNESIIKAQIAQKGQFVAIEVSNSLPEMPANTSGTGVGLENIRRRLTLIYGSPSYLAIEKVKESFTVKIYIPVN